MVRHTQHGTVEPIAHLLHRLRIGVSCHPVLQLVRGKVRLPDPLAILERIDRHDACLRFQISPARGKNDPRTSRL